MVKRQMSKKSIKQTTSADIEYMKAEITKLTDEINVRLELLIAKEHQLCLLIDAQEVYERVRSDK